LEASQITIHAESASNKRLKFLQCVFGYRMGQNPATLPLKDRTCDVISGTFNLGMGDKFDQANTRAMLAGTFGFLAAGMKHFVWVKGDTVVQLHGIGPWTITYVNPSDDPRNVKK
jgi:hypothetical protein